MQIEDMRVENMQRASKKQALNARAGLPMSAALCPGVRIRDEYLRSPFLASFSP